MTPNRLPLVAALMLMVAGTMVLASDRPAPLDAVFATVEDTATPYVPTAPRTTSSWFCPGVPAAGSGLTGAVVVSNPTAEPIQGRYTLMTPEGRPVTETFEAAAYDNVTIEVADEVEAPFAAAMVEIDGGLGIVEQIARHPAGDAVAPCANNPSDTWYFADGWTVGDSVQHLLITNPFPGRAIVDIGFVTRAGARSPTAFQGFVVPAEGMRVIDLADAGVQDEPLIALSVEATSGQVVAGRSQHMIDGGRLGYTMTLGAPSLDDQWWFADGAAGEGITETFVVYNPTDDDVEADIVFLGLELDENSPPPEPVTLTVPERSVVTYGTAAAGLPVGLHGAVVSTLTSDSIVVERVLTQPAGESVATTVQLGSQSSYVSTRWHAPVGVRLPIEDALVVLNVSFNPGTVTVKAVGPGGALPVPGLEDVEIPANGILSIDLVDPALVGEHLVVDADVPVVTERRWERDPDLRGRSSSLALPEF